MSNDLIKQESSDNKMIQRGDAIMNFHASWNKWEQIATTVFKSGMLNTTVWKSPQAVMLGFMKCYELGIPPMTGIMGMFSVNNKIGMEVTLQNAVIQGSGERVELKITDGEGLCKIYMKRKDGAEYEAMFTRQDAQKAGLLSKDNWKNYEKDMLRSRAFAIGNRVLFSHVLLGMHYTPEELGADVTIHNGEEVLTDAAVVFDEQMEFERLNKTVIELAKSKPSLEQLQNFYDINKNDIAQLPDNKMSLVMTTLNRELKKYGEQYVISRHSIKKQDNSQGTSTTSDNTGNVVTDATIVGESNRTDTESRSEGSGSASQ